MSATIQSEIYETLTPIINTEKCCGDELCINVCPRHCFSLNTEKKAQYKPRIRSCFQCGHCIAICPKGAISFENVDAVDVELEKTHLDVQALSNLIKMRRSIRNFKEKPVPEEDLIKALNTVIYAPSGENLQDVSWLIVSDKEVIKEISRISIEVFSESEDEEAAEFGKAMLAGFNRGRNRIAYNAPQIVFAYTPQGSLDAIDPTIAMSYLELVLTSMGIGTCWAGFVSWAAAENKKLHNLLGIDENYSLSAAMLVGYAKFKFRRSTMRKALRVHTI